MSPRPFRFENQNPGAGASRPMPLPACSDGRRFKVLLPARASTQLPLFAYGLATPAEKDSRPR